MRCLHPIIVLALLVCAAGSISIRAHAQQPPRVLLGGDPQVPPLVQQRLAGLFSRLGPVVPTGTPPQPGEIAVIANLAPGPGGAILLRLTYYDAVSGATLLGDDLPILGNGDLSPQYDSYILGRAQTAASMLQSRAAGPPPPQGMPPMRPGPAPRQGPGPQPPMGPPEGEGSPEGQGPPQPEGPPGRPVAGALAVGVGPGMHQAVLPTDTGTHQLPLSVFPALDLLFQIDGVSHDGSVTPGVRFAYRTSVGYRIDETPPNGQKVSSPARTHELLLDIVANINFGDSRKDVSLPLAFGVAMNNTRTDIELSWPRYSLAGPHARALLRIPIADGDVVLTFGPDVEYIVAVSSALRRVGLERSGVAFGGEAQLAIRLSERYALRALFRETHASVSSARVSRAFSDVQRFLTLGFAATF